MIKSFLIYPVLLLIDTLYQLPLVPVTFTLVPLFNVVRRLYDVDGPFLTLIVEPNTIYSFEANGVTTFSLK